VQTFCRPIDIFREQSTGAATRLLQRKKLCQSTIYFANGAAIAFEQHIDICAIHETEWKILISAMGSILAIEGKKNKATKQGPKQAGGYSVI
jgi:hypothetical protein